MREILSLHIGQAGIQMGDACWELLRLEHEKALENEKIKIKSKNGCLHDTFFFRTSMDEIKPRALMIDLEPTVIDELEYGKNKDLFTAHHKISGKEDAANNYARGYYTAGRKITDEVADRIRQFVEDCSQLQAFSLFHSCGGGTGSGLSAYILEELEENFPKVSRVSFSCWPSPMITTAITEPYNSIFAANSLMELTDFTVMVDNQACYDILSTSLGIPSPHYTTLNQLISQLVSAWTASLRYNGSLNVDVNEIQVNLVPFPRVHFLLSSYAPLFPASLKTVQDSNTSVQAITTAAFQSSNMFAKCDPTAGKFVSCCLIYRGAVTPRDTHLALDNMKQKLQVNFVDWCPTGFKSGLNDEPPLLDATIFAPVSKAVCMMSNNTAMSDVFRRTMTKFDMLYARRAFVHWYINEEMEEIEFEEAREHLETLQKEYKSIEGNQAYYEEATTEDYEASDTSSEI